MQQQGLSWMASAVLRFMKRPIRLGILEALIDSWILVAMVEQKSTDAIGYHKISGIRKGLESVYLQTGKILRAI